MEIKPLDKQQLDAFVAARPHSQFLQSWNWGEFQKNVGQRVWRFSVFSQNKLIASAQIIGHALKFKKGYLYCPRGPIIDRRLTAEKKTEAVKLILSKARDLTIQTSRSEEIFLRLEPIFKFQSSIFDLQPTKGVQPSTTLILNLSLTADNLLINMHPKTRYNIKLAEKKNIIIRRGSLADFERVWEIFAATGQRDKFNLHPKSYYQNMLEALKEVELWLALADNKIIAANLISFFGDTATYLHGASDYDSRQLMAPYLLQWTIINEVKKRGYKYYDFHGIAPEHDFQNSKFEIQNSKPHPWAGITRFKKGFGGQVFNYPGTFDFIYEQNWYRMYKIIRKINYLKGKL